MTGKSLIILLVNQALILAASREASGQSGLLTISADRKVDLVIIDPLGRRTGFDPMTNQDYSEIPDANYGYEEEACEFMTSEDSPPINGKYTIRSIGVSKGNFSVSCFGTRDTVNWAGVSIQGTTVPGRVLYYSLVYSQDPNDPVTLSLVAPTKQVSGGIFSPSRNALSVRAKPSITIGAGSMLKTGVVTIGWLTSDGKRLGTVSSNYGFTKWGSVIIAGRYSYQKFRTTTATSLSWSATIEYDLLTVQVSSADGHGAFYLVNAIPGGEWFIDINYSDKSDTSFYSGWVSK